MEIDTAIEYFKDAVRESDEIIADCIPELQAELLEQKQHFVVALAVLELQRDAKPKALTLKELRKMDGEPVWFELTDDFYTGYYIVDNNNQSLCGRYGVLLYDSVFADGISCKLFDRKPKEGC